MRIVKFKVNLYYELSSSEMKRAFIESNSGPSGFTNEHNTI